MKQSKTRASRRRARTSMATAQGGLCVLLIIIVAATSTCLAQDAQEEATVPTTFADSEEKLYPPDVKAGEFFAQLPRFGDNLFETAPAEAVALRYKEQASAAARPEEESLLVSVPVPADYLLGPGDELAIRCWTGAVEHYADTVVVSQQGTVYVELLGELAVHGLTLADLRQMLKQRFAGFYQDTQVTVTMARIRTIDVYVTGDAKWPGRYSLTGTATAFSALYRAGGPSEIGSLRSISLLRKAEPPRKVDLYAYLLSGDRSGNVPLQSGDTIFVKPAGAMVGIAGQVRREARYEIQAGTTLAEAVQMSGGLGAAGYAPNVEVWRVAEHADRHVLNVNLGEEGETFALQDGDLVLVRPVVERPANTVELIGAVKRPGVYEVGEKGLDLADLVARAQGPTDTAYVKQGAVWRLNDDNQYEMHTFDVKLAMAGDRRHNLVLAPNDKVLVYQKEEVLPPQEVSVTGAVGNPGMFAWVADMTVSGLLLQARGLLPDAYVERADLLRIGPDQRRQLVPVDLAAILRGDTEADMVLQAGDQLTVYDRTQRGAPSIINVSGFVNKPGEYERYSGLRASDAIYLAGGLSAAAGRTILYSRGKSLKETETMHLVLTKTDEGFVVEPDLVLEDYDHVAVQGLGEMLVKPQVVTIEGKVKKPGVYTLQPSAEEPETVYRLLQKADGLLEDANPCGIVVYRTQAALAPELQSDETKQVMRTFNREMTGSAPEAELLTEKERSAAMGGRIEAQLGNVFGSGDTIAIVVPPRPLDLKQWAQAIPVDGHRLLQTQGAEGDVELRDGDVVVVPKMSSVVSVLGTVVRPGALRYQPGKSYRDYIEMAGGTADDAMTARTVVIRANGQTELAHKTEEIRAGDIIIVPSQYLVRTVQKGSTWTRILKTLVGIATAILVF